MDNPQEPPAVLSLCSGYGGLEIGIERVIGSINVIAHVEIEAFAVTNLVRKIETGKMAPSLIYTNLKTFNYKILRGKIDIITGGYPCQPFSKGGNRKGKDDPRHLWPYIRDAIDIIRPRLCFFENVEGHITEGLYDVLDDLGGLGYQSTWGIFSASEVGASHNRKRIFILAYSKSDRPQFWASLRNESGYAGSNSNSGLWPAKQGESQHPKEKPRTIESRVVGANDGVENWIDRLRLLGNGVVPQTAELAVRTLMKELNNA